MAKRIEPERPIFIPDNLRAPCKTAKIPKKPDLGLKGIDRVFYEAQMAQYDLETTKASALLEGKLAVCSDRGDKLVGIIDAHNDALPKGSAK